ncbi:MAG TPA: DUF3179 domain-containing protein [Flavobacteriaceae bacterium]|nr:DUF3179 domain-containing protein [Flavobacteriaceae bacterium]
MKKILILYSIVLIFSCSNGGDGKNDNANTPQPEPEVWLIDKNKVLDGGPGKDGIPSIDNPKFVEAQSQVYINDNDLVVGVKYNNEVKAYPHDILNWHEIVNDAFNDQSLTINYCPLTGTAFGWQSMSNGEPSTFGVSGLLYLANLILYDRNTDSNWSQMLLQCVNGDLMGDFPTTVNVIETNWLTWKNLYPNTKVLSRDTGFYNDSHYNNYPYGPYLTVDDFFIFQVFPLNSTLPFKQRVYAIINNTAKVYQFSDFEGGNAIVDSFNGKNYLVVGNENVINAFELTNDFSNLNFEYCFNDTEVFFKDNEGNNWSIFGNAISGPREGQNLITPKSVVSFWFAIAAFYPDPEIYSN